jgi:predicted RNA methylase
LSPQRSNDKQNYSRPQTLSPQRRNDKKNLVFDKRDFLFPDTPKEIREQVQLDEVAMYSVTDTRTADKISDFIAKLPGLNQGNIVITDGTACAGGNTISFCKKFKRVQAVEVNRNRYDMLRHNLKLLKCYNVTYYHDNYLNLLQKLTQDVVFLDPPWGGPSYKEKEEIELLLGNTALDEVCENLKSKTKYIIIKAPPNLNCEKFKEKISGNLQFYHDFRKMLLIVVDYYDPSKVVQQKQVKNDSSRNENRSRDEGKKDQDKDANDLP